MKKIIFLLVFHILLFSQDRFINKGNIVYDGETKLYWQKKGVDKLMSWSEAKRYCENLSLDGYDDWRLPNIDELKSLVDYSKYHPAIATNKIKINLSYVKKKIFTDDTFITRFITSPLYVFWSNSSHVIDSSIVYCISFNDGITKISSIKTTLPYTSVKRIDDKHKRVITTNKNIFVLHNTICVRGQ